MKSEGTFTSADSRAIDAARAAHFLLGQNDNEYVDPYTTCDPLIPAIIHDLLLLARFLGDDPEAVMAEGMRWFRVSEEENFSMPSEEAGTEEWMELRKEWASKTLEEIHSLYHDGDKVHLMACMARLDDKGTPARSGEETRT